MYQIHNLYTINIELHHKIDSNTKYNYSFNELYPEVPPPLPVFSLMNMMIGPNVNKKPSFSKETQ